MRFGQDFGSYSARRSYYGGLRRETLRLLTPEEQHLVARNVLTGLLTLRYLHERNTLRPDRSWYGRLGNAQKKPTASAVPPPSPEPKILPRNGVKGGGGLALRLVSARTDDDFFPVPRPVSALGKDIYPLDNRVFWATPEA